MMEDDRAELIEDTYGMPPGRVMYHLYWERDMSAAEIANEITSTTGESVHRNTVKYWLQNAGVKMRSRTLTDVQRILIMAYLSAGLGVDATSDKADCGRMTVHRYRKEIKTTGSPVDLNTELSTREYEILCGIIRDDIMDDSDKPTESTSDCAVDSD